MSGADRLAVLVERLTLSFKGPGRRVDLFRHFDLEVPAGDRLALLGPSGSGKSSLLYTMCGLLQPEAGLVLVSGVDLANSTDRQKADIRLRQIGFVFQEFNLLGHLSAIDNVALPLRLTGIAREKARKRSAALLEKVGMDHRLKNRPHELSAGEQQRVAVARALANEPSLLLADEPTGNLDDQSASLVIDLLTGLDLSAALVVATHDPRIADRATRIVRLERSN